MNKLLVLPNSSHLNLYLIILLINQQNETIRLYIPVGLNHHLFLFVCLFVCKKRTGTLIPLQRLPAYVLLRCYAYNSIQLNMRVPLYGYAGVGEEDDIRWLTE